MSRAVALALLLAGCGVKAPPRPPERHAPAAHPEPAAATSTAGACESCPAPTRSSPSASQ